MLCPLEWTSALGARLAAGLCGRSLASSEADRNDAIIAAVAGPDAASISRTLNILTARRLDDFSSIPHKSTGRIDQATSTVILPCAKFRPRRPRLTFPNSSMTSSAGETIVITRHGRAIARIVPEAHLRQAEVDRAIASIKAFRRRTGKITVDALVSAKHEGHKY